MGGGIGGGGGIGRGGIGRGGIGGTTVRPKRPYYSGSDIPSLQFDR